MRGAHAFGVHRFLPSPRDSLGSRSSRPWVITRFYHIRLSSSLCVKTPEYSRTKRCRLYNGEFSELPMVLRQSIFFYSRHVYTYMTDEFFCRCTTRNVVVGMGRLRTAARVHRRHTYLRAVTGTPWLIKIGMLTIATTQPRSTRKTKRFWNLLGRTARPHWKLAHLASRVV